MCTKKPCCCNGMLLGVEQIKQWTIPARNLGIETGELTPTLKVKRNKVNEHFAEDMGEDRGAVKPGLAYEIVATSVRIPRG